MRIAAASVLVAALAVFAAACGSTQHASTTSTPALAFAQCMRAHHVPNWPDPESNGTFDKTKLTTQLLGATSAQLQAAQSACKHFLPNGGNGPSAAQLQQAKVQALSFSRCVRAHGVSTFPDPDSTGRIPEQWPGVDQGSPVFEAANNACAKYRPPYVPSNAAYNAYARTHPNGS